MSVSPLAVVVCTRNRPEQVMETAHRLLAQRGNHFAVWIVDQSDEDNRELLDLARREPRITVLRDRGQGLSRARNLGVRATDTEWVAFVDDDCHVEEDFAEALSAFVAGRPDAEFVSGNVSAGNRPAGDYLEAATAEVARERRIAGRWVLPWDIGLGVCMAVRRQAVERLGGWDERLGPGVPDFPAADDMDFNWRLLRSGGVAYVTPRLQATHDQWRTPRELDGLYEGYMRAWMGFSIKQLRGGDVAGGLWLGYRGLIDVMRMFGSAARRRSPARLRTALYKLRGFAIGIVKAALRRW
jgi:GT2 family glycosyltransferase